MTIKEAIAAGICPETIRTLLEHIRNTARTLNAIGVDSARIESAVNYTYNQPYDAKRRKYRMPTCDTTALLIAQDHYLEPERINHVPADKADRILDVMDSILADCIRIDQTDIA